jgi:Protein of unknown function (DUF5818)
MKKFAIAMSLALVLGLVSLSATLHLTTARAATADNASFSGEIMDSACAGMGSHDAMMKKEGAKTAKACTLKCVKAGSKFVLYDASKSMTYQLDDQAKAKKFAGQKVTVMGTYDDGSKTIHVASIGAGAM